ncbi:hypothetical protein C0558_08270 [Serratia marcescens]|nr:hypothetical protein C0558_08270 [Serratia marcescens]
MKVRADAESAIVGGRLDSDDLAGMYWSVLQEDDERMRYLEGAMNVRHGALKSTDDFLYFYKNADPNTRENVRKHIAETLIYDDSKSYIDLISDNADTFAHVFLNLSEHFGVPIDESATAATEGAMSLVSGLAQSFMEK